jgi:methionine-gamma-lyase
VTRRGFATRAIHSKAPEIEVASRPIAPPIVQTTSFGFERIEDLSGLIGRPQAGYGYSRAGNPTVAELERSLAELEGAEDALATNAGVAAIWAITGALCQAGDHVVAQRALYGGTQALLTHVLSRYGIETTYVDHDDLDAWRAALRPNTRMLYAETVGNPTLAVPDLAAIAELAHGHGAKLVVDATFTTPYLSRPLEQGVDVVVHSATKYLGGHGDLVAGVVAGERGLLDRARGQAILTGVTCTPFVAWLILRGLKTLSLRMDRHVASARRIAAHLEARPEVARVWHPDLPSHFDHERAQRDLPRGTGGVVSLQLRGGMAAALEFVHRLELFTIAGSLGDAHSLVTIPSQVSHKHVPDEALEAAGIPVDLVRLAIGLEDAEDLIADLDAALAG